MWTVEVSRDIHAWPSQCFYGNTTRQVSFLGQYSNSAPNSRVFSIFIFRTLPLSPLIGVWVPAFSVFQQISIFFFLFCGLAFMTVSLRLQEASEPRGGLVETRGWTQAPEFLIHQVWGGAWECAFLTGSQVLMLHFGVLRADFIVSEVSTLHAVLAPFLSFCPFRFCP